MASEVFVAVRVRVGVWLAVGCKSNSEIGVNRTNGVGEYRIIFRAESTSAEVLFPICMI